MAKHLNISVSTVSRALNNHSDINEMTKEKVLKAVGEMKYRPNTIARSLIQNKTYTVGLMVPDIADPFFSNVALGIEEVLSAQGYQVVYGNTSRNKAKEKKFIESVFDRKMDGILLTPDNLDEDIISMLRNLKVPALFLRRRTPNSLNIPYIDVDHYEGACKAVEHLLSKGHRNICFMGMTEDSFISNERLRGFMETMHKHGIYPNDNQIVIAGRTIESGKLAMEKLYKKNKNMTALFASNDLLGIGALEWLSKNNIDVPNEVSVIGFDNLELSELYWIQMTTMAQPREMMGKMAAEKLLKMMDNSEKGKSILLHAELIRRQTC
ncbi:LacI family DNA-binding transcriptional regulator [Virgibacillus sp. SK37]|uniref:LacI family DNA-binding transcriptional regulator n=1 Tax=Virgibacillus sp. SK37 TaxID=403957 RepID=UPI002102C3B8|nr:LacI family DNA-binding transcriptional regulator [Virgibacillus sp. SK37]